MNATATITRINEELFERGALRSFDTITITDADGAEIDTVAVESDEDSAPYDAALIEAGWTITSQDSDGWTLTR